VAAGQAPRTPEPRQSHDERAIPPAGATLDASSVDHQPIAEWLPERYRNVLDRISDLEGAGRHADADRIRRSAIRAYSKRWNEGTAGRLDDLATQASQLLATAVSAPAGRGIAAWLRRRPRAASATVASASLTSERPTA
jgi:hypothetical protein